MCCKKIELSLQEALVDVPYFSNMRFGLIVAIAPVFLLALAVAVAVWNKKEGFFQKRKDLVATASVSLELQVNNVPNLRKLHYYPDGSFYMSKGAYIQGPDGIYNDANRSPPSYLTRMSHRSLARERERRPRPDDEEDVDEEEEEEERRPRPDDDEDVDEEEEQEETSSPVPSSSPSLSPSSAPSSSGSSSSQPSSSGPNTIQSTSASSSRSESSPSPATSSSSNVRSGGAISAGVFGALVAIVGCLVACMDQKMNGTEGFAFQRANRW